LIKIIVDHTKIIINDYDLGDCEPLEYFFSIYNPITHIRFPFGLHYIEERRQLIIPRGVDISYIRNLFKSVPQLNRKHDPMDKIEPIGLTNPPRDNTQRTALRFMLGKDEFYYTSSKSMLSLNLLPGKGKTYCAIATTAFIRYRSIMLTSSLKWINQWKDAILEHSDIKPKEIFIISGTPSIHMLLNRGVNNYKFILASIDTIISYGEKYGFDKVSELFIKLRVGIKYVDEAHLDFKAIMMIDFYTNTYKSYYMTGTPIRSNEDEDKIYKMYFKNVPSINLFDENKDPHTDYLALRYNSHPNPQDISYCRNKYGLDRNKYTGSYIIRRPNFYNILRVILHKTLAKKGKILIYIGVNKSIDKVKEWIELYYPFLKGHIGVYNSVNKEDKSEQLKKKYILSTTKSCGAAMDIKGLACSVILAEPFKSEPLAIQTLGRTRDDNTMCIEAVDEGFKAIMKFYYYKQPIMKRYAKSIDEERYNDYSLEKQVEEIFDMYYGDGDFPEIYLENNLRLFMMRQECRPLNEYDSKGRKIIMRRDG